MTGKIKLPNVTKRYGAKVAAELLRRDKPKPQRSVPKLKRHPLGMAYVQFRVKKSRRNIYFGVWNSEAAARKYKNFAKRWPAQLYEPWVAGSWPKKRLLTHAGRTQTLARWAAEFGLKPTTL